MSMSMSLQLNFFFLTVEFAHMPTRATGSRHRAMNGPSLPPAHTAFLLPPLPFCRMRLLHWVTHTKHKHTQVHLPPKSKSESRGKGPLQSLPVPACPRQNHAIPSTHRPILFPILFPSRPGPVQTEVDQYVLVDTFRLLYITLHPRTAQTQMKKSGEI